MSIAKIDRLILFALGIVVAVSFGYYVLSEGWRVGLLFWSIAILSITVEAALWAYGQSVMGWLLDKLFPN